MHRLLTISCLLTLIGIQQGKAEDVEQVNGAFGIICKTAAAVESFIQATASLTDTEFNALDIQEATQKQCSFAKLHGMIVGVTHTFLRRDQRVVDVLKFTPSVMVGGVYLYTFKVRPASSAVGL